MTEQGKDKGFRHNRRRMTCLKLLMTLLLALLMLPLATAGVQAAPDDVELVSKNVLLAAGNNASFNPRISSDGRYVVFASSATNLVEPATTGIQVFRKDLLTGEVELVSSDALGMEGNATSDFPDISADGRYVAFQSEATNLVDIATSKKQIYRKDMLTQDIYLVSMTPTAAEGNGDSSLPSISDDGDYVAFYSTATDLVEPNTSGTQVFRRKMAMGLVELASANAAGTQGGGNAYYSPDISPDGRYVSFTSTSTDLVTPATFGQELFSKDMETAEVKLVSSDAVWAESDQSNGFPSYSSDARYVSFASNASNLISGVGGQQVYRKDLLSGEIVLVSADAEGNQGTGGLSQASQISADGRYVAFESYATNLVTPPSSGYQIFRKDLLTEEVVMASADAVGTQGDGTSRFPSISTDGRYTAFFSNSTNLVEPATTTQHVFRKELDVPYYFYFAEGYTGPGFQEYLCLGNPEATGAFATITYMFPDGSTQEQEVELAANSRVTVNVNAVVGDDREVSAKIGSDIPFVAERPMYFSYGSGWTGGHDTVGAPSPATNWYFAEGYTGPGFEEWICVLNPGDLPAELTFFFQTREVGQLTVPGPVVGPNTRRTFKVNDLLGGNTYQTSLKLVADHPVVAERSMYFNYTGMGSRAWTGGHCVMGAPRLATEYFFAEGTTRTGFDEWLTIQNTGEVPAVIHAVYNLSEGAPVEKDYGVDPGWRFSIYVPYEIGSEKDASVHLSSRQYFLAERPMYFAYPGLGNWGWTGGHCVIGATGSALEWFFAEGYTGDGFEEWLCIQNPGAAEAHITATYYPEGGGAPVARDHKVAPGARYTIAVNADLVSVEMAVSARLSSDEQVIVERPMYFSYGPGAWTGGHDVVGFTP